MIVKTTGIAIGPPPLIGVKITEPVRVPGDRPTGFTAITAWPGVWVIVLATTSQGVFGVVVVVNSRPGVVLLMYKPCACGEGLPVA